MVGVPCVLMALLRYIYDGQPLVFERVGPMLLAIFPFVVMFVVTSVAMLRERTSGTLELLLTKPLSKGELLAGYALGFGVAAVVQVAAASALTKGPLCTAVLWCWRWWR
jgi:ABC-2 type transport system permease protein